MLVFFHKIIAVALSFLSLVASPLSLVHVPNTAEALNSLVEQAQPRPALISLYNGMSPTVLTLWGQRHLWFSGKPTASAADGMIYGSVFDSGQWSSPTPVFGVSGFRVSDPSVIVDPTNPMRLLMYYTSISNADAASTTAARLKNQIHWAYSVDQGATWVEGGAVINQNNDLDQRGGWAPSALVVGNEIWLYYSTNYPGSVDVYRTRFDFTGHALGTERMYLVDGGQKQLSGFNVDVSYQNGRYVLFLNTDFSGIVRYVSADGVHWQTASGETNPVIKANTGSLVAAPTVESSATTNIDGTTYQYNLFFAGGHSATGMFDTIYELSGMPIVSTQIMYANNNLTQSQGQTWGSSASSGSGSSFGALAGVGLGIAGIAGFSLLSDAAPAGAAALVTAPEAATNPVSYGGRVIAWLPCVSVLGPSFWVTLAPASPLLHPYMYIWTPATLLNLVPPSPSIPPSHVGQEIMGRFDIPYWCCLPIALPTAPGVCLIPGDPPVPIPPLLGLRMQTAGVSPI